MENKMVSIIIPVYNVYDEIDRCMESVVNQTYKDIEIILINDGSTDNSPRKCEKWEKRDTRIKYISKENEGLGPTRNLGIDMATAEYIMFVDSDDWVDCTIVEKLVNKLIKTGADLAVCDRYEVKVESDEHTIILQDLDEVIDVDNDNRVVSKISTSPCAKVYKKELYTKYGIKQPNHYYEDAVTLVIASLCKKICYISEPLYYYVVDRSGSITNDLSALDSLTDYLETAVGLFKKYNLFDKRKDDIREMCIKRVNWNMFRAEKTLNQKLVDICKQNELFIEKHWGAYELNRWKSIQILEKQFYIWGSYNLMTSMKMLMRMNTPRFPENHYSYSSIISAMNTEDGNMNNIVIEHDNEFRKSHLIKEFQRTFANKNLGEFSQSDYIVIDFLDERFDIGECDGKLLTISDAFMSMKNSENIVYNRYDRKEAKVQELWEKSCIKFIEMLRNYFKDKMIILVKMKLAECYGNLEEKKEFDNIQDIRTINNILQQYYQFFAEKCPEAVVVEVEDSQWYYTDRDYRHGCYPYHLNGYMYREIQRRIEENIWKK